MVSGPYEYLSTVYELNQTAIELQDPDLSDALDTVIKLISKPDVPARVVAPMLVKLQAQAVAFRMKAKYFMLINKDGNANVKKNIYLTMADAIKDLVDALKYLVRAA